MRAEFVATVSHELRTPLTSIKGSVLSVLEDTDDLDLPEIRQFLRIIRDQTDIMRDMIGDLLDVAQIEAGTLPVSPLPEEVADVVDRARRMFLRAGGRDYLDIKLSPDLPRILVDQRRIGQVIVNLLNNAERHSPEMSTIWVTAARSGQGVEISVIDEGEGISGERLPYIFKKFSRGDYPGRDSGLGLAICKGIVEAHGGRIWAASKGPGQGTRFAFTLPEAEVTKEEEQAPPSSSLRPAPKGGETILVVDDDPQTLRLLRNVLANAGYSPIGTADPEETISLVANHHPQLVLLDLMIPGANGINLMRDILNITDVPVIFVSSYGQDRVVAQALDSGAADYIVKPFSPTELAARVRATLRKGTGSDQSVPSEPFVVGGLTIDYAERKVILDGRPVELRAKEYLLLYELSINAGRVVTYDKLLKRIWGAATRPNDLRALRTHVRQLRQKLGENATNPTYFFTESGVGYRMSPMQNP